MEHLEQEILVFVSNIYNAFSWPGVVVMMAIESACIPLPSEVVMPLSGWMLIKDRGLGPIFTALAGFYGALGCTIGSIIAYWAGAWGGRPLIERYGKYILISRHDLDRADEWFDKYGDWAIFFSRLMPVIRTFISFPAGVARMHLSKFLIYTFLGSFPWCFGLAYGGFVLGEHWERLRAVMRPFDIPIVAAILALIIFYVYRHVRRAMPES